MLKETEINKQVSFFRNGKVSSIDYFINDKKHGVCKKYFPDGNVYIIETWYKGTKNGSFEVFDINGKRVIYEIYVKNKLLRSYL